MSTSPEIPNTARDDLTPHLQALHTELGQTIQDMEAIGATSAACAHYQAQQTCARFLTTPHALAAPARS
ncbi:hypothetical protein [Nesterenkonia sp. CF4.4]|uniref:hypothetical protein n=1 Tax=Nesterenkonia sp. CF4.4 TaxID=3373079 RepID=UPI003EE75331